MGGQHVTGLDNLPVLGNRDRMAFGGFSGGDNVVEIPELSQMVASGKLRYILNDPNLANQKPGIYNWLQRNCKPVSIPGTPVLIPLAPRPGGEEPLSLYDCGAMSTAH